MTINDILVVNNHLRLYMAREPVQGRCAMVQGMPWYNMVTLMDGVGWHR